MKKGAFLFALALLVAACGAPEGAQEIVDKAILAAGGDRYDRATVDFKFRNRQYRSTRGGGIFIYERITRDSLAVTHDILSNDGFTRRIDMEETPLPDSLSSRYAQSVNSVIYFALLPYGLNDVAAQKELLGEVTIKSRDYYKIRVTFRQEGGGVDFDDVFVYWIDKEHYHIDYLAYEFHVNGGGFRFREARRPRTIEGIRFVDYINYKPAGNNVTVESLDDLYTAGQLKTLSEIVLEEVQVAVR